MAEVTNHIEAAWKIFAVVQEEYQRARLEPTEKGITTFRNACGKAWLAVLEATNAFFLKQGVTEDELPKNDRGRRYLTEKYMDRDLKKTFIYLRHTFHIDGYYEGTLEFETMPRYFEELKEYIETLSAY